MLRQRPRAPLSQSAPNANGDSETKDIEHDTSLYDFAKIRLRMLPGLYIICYICGSGSECDRTSVLLAEAETAAPLSRSTPNADRSSEVREVERDTTYIADDIPGPGSIRSRPVRQPSVHHEKKLSRTRRPTLDT